MTIARVSCPAITMTVSPTPGTDVGDCGKCSSYSLGLFNETEALMATIAVAARVLPFCGRSLSITIETPAKGRAGWAA